MMKKQAWILLVAGVLGAVSGAENLIKNGDFSREGAEWRSPQYTGGRKFHTFRDGKLLISGNPEARYNSFVSLVQALPTLTPGREYLLTAAAETEVKDPTKKYLQIRVRQADDTGKTILYSGITVDLTQSGVRRYAAKFRPAPNAAKFTLYVISANFTAEDRAAVDDLSLTEQPVRPGAAENLVQNGDFEAPNLKPWKTDVGRAKTAPFTVVDDPETANRILSVNGDPTNRYAKFLALKQELPPLTAGKKYRLSARVKAGLKETAGKQVVVQVRESDMDNVTIVYDGFKVALDAPEWKEYQTTFIPRIEADKFQLYVRSTSLAEGDTVLVDEVTLTEVK